MKAAVGGGEEELEERRAASDEHWTEAWTLQVEAVAMASNR